MRASLPGAESVQLESPLLIPPRLQAATLASRWQASIVHLEQALREHMAKRAQEGKGSMTLTALKQFTK